MKRLTLATALALLFSSAPGIVLATMPTMDNPSQSTDAPVDCKKTPEHPRCADKK